MAQYSYPDLEALDLRQRIWERFFTIAPLVLVGTIDADGTIDLAPKHMAFPLGWDNFFGFVCTPSHSTYQNIERTSSFTVSYPRHDDIVEASLTAAPRCENSKPIMDLVETFPAQQVAGVFAKNAYLFFECELMNIYDGFGDNSLIAGKIVAAYADPKALRRADRDDADVLLSVPQLAYLYPGRFAIVDETQAFPFPAGMRR
jgi:flavin reductase (DIM6/NTAB) family NADH-FMN oxidoreductase RutF